MTDSRLSTANCDGQPALAEPSCSASVILAEAYHRHKAALETIEKICHSTKHKNPIADILREIERSKAK